MKEPSKCQSYFHKSLFVTKTRKNGQSLFPLGQGNSSSGDSLFIFKEEQKEKKKSPRNFIFAIRWEILFCDLLMSAYFWSEDKKVVEDVSNFCFTAALGITYSNFTASLLRKKRKAHPIMSLMAYCSLREGTAQDFLCWSLKIHIQIFSFRHNTWTHAFIKGPNCGESFHWEAPCSQGIFLELWDRICQGLKGTGNLCCINDLHRAQWWLQQTAFLSAAVSVSLSNPTATPEEGR